MIAILAALVSLPTPTDSPFLQFPDIHGDKIAFTCEGDIWVGSLSEGTASRLTRDAWFEFEPHFSPDGTEIAYSVQENNRSDAYAISVDGGQRRRLTFQNRYQEVLDWSPDGKKVAVRNFMQPPSAAVYLVPSSGGYTEQIPLELCSDFSFAEDGHRFAFNRFLRGSSGSPEAWLRYRGGQKNDVWIGDLQSKSFKKIYQGEYSAENIRWVGGKVYFTMQEATGASLYSIDPAGGKPVRLFGPSPLEVLHVNSDGKRLIYQHGWKLEMFDPATKIATPVKMKLLSDESHTTPYSVPASNFVSFFSVGPTGKRVLAESRGQIVSMQVAGSDTSLWKAVDGARLRYPQYSPDGKRIAYVSDETGEQQIWIAPADGSAPTQITKTTERQIRRFRWSPDGKMIAYTTSKQDCRLIKLDNQNEDIEFGFGSTGWDGIYFSFSPDSKWVAFTQATTPNRTDHVWLYEIATGKKTEVTGPIISETSPEFSPDGKFLAVLSSRQFATRWDEALNQLNTGATMRPILYALKSDTLSPLANKISDESSTEKKADEAKAVKVEIELEGLNKRFVELPVPAYRFTNLRFAGNRLFLASENGISFYDLVAKKGGEFAEAPAFDVSADGSKILLMAGDAAQVVDAGADSAGGSGKVSFAAIRLQINPKTEWKQEYWDAWRIIRDYFYVANMHGNDWAAIGKKYAEFLPFVRSRDELNSLIRWLLAELSVSHTGVNGGDSGPGVESLPCGDLGFNVEPGENGYYRIKRLYTGDGIRMDRSPLAEPGMNVKGGDYLIEIGGIPAKVGQPYLDGLIGRIGQIVEVKVNSKPTPIGARTLLVKPITQSRRLRYLDWVRTQREYVAAKSGGKVGYIHIASMTPQDMTDFIAQYFAQRDKDALMLDIRFNTGGSISNSVISVLKQTLVAYFWGRGDSYPWTRQGDFFDGPMCCLINEENISNGEELPHQFRALKLGPLIGRRTIGGEVGSDPGWPLADGGIVSVPNYGAWNPKEGWIIEEKGVDPDIDVEQDPNAVVKGQNPQLDRALSYLLGELAKQPKKPLVRPADPVKVKK